MTRQEVLDENKSTEGNPLMKQARRSKHLQISRNRMMASIAQADVVVVNPTHYAVALRYEAGSGPPQVLAKGVDAVARRIRERAAEHRVPMVEDVPLARALHAGCEVGDEIPGELFEAVAHVLAFVMSLKVRGSASGLHRDTRRTGDVPDGDSLRRARRSRRRRAPGASPNSGSGSAPLVPKQSGPGRRQDGHGSATGGSPDLPRTSNPTGRGRVKASEIGRYAVPVGVVGIILLLVVPLPAMLLDGLIVLNIGLSILVLMVAMYVTRPLEFSIFPALLLVMTLFRLGLNVASTRLVLLRRLRRGGRGRLRRVRHRRLARRRPRHLPHPRRHPVRGHHQRCDAGGRGGRPVHPGRAARQADGHRRGPQLRPHRRGHRPPPARGGLGRGRLLRRHGRCVEVRQGRRDRLASSSPSSTWSAASASAWPSAASAGARRCRPTRCSPSATAWSPRCRPCCCRWPPASSSPAPPPRATWAPTRPSSCSAAAARCSSPAAPSSCWPWSPACPCCRSSSSARPCWAWPTAP